MAVGYSYGGSGGGGGGGVATPPLIVQEEGGVISPATTTINFVGAGVTATGSGTVVVTIPTGALPLTVKENGTDINTSTTFIDFLMPSVGLVNLAGVLPNTGVTVDLTSITSSTTPKEKIIDIINYIPANTNLNINVATASYTISGDPLFIGASSVMFVNNKKLSISVNGVEARKQVEAMYFNSQTFYLDLELDVGDYIIIKEI